MVRHGGSFYHFRTVEQAAGFLRALQDGKSVESCRRRWRPSLVQVAASVAAPGIAAQPGKD
ncbi:hypothetical protein CAL28_08660 [Bordetella genomosp. 11]|uniref:Uncharacterized protein n=2 Tax=Bordetella genomosp. 11 TaxID=1416808 RepID=A0A261UDA4_9BORD|nr:hypothetical protein CAL28_08660 [Bordetella genomosp. 11]